MSCWSSFRLSSGSRLLEKHDSLSAEYFPVLEELRFLPVTGPMERIHDEEALRRSRVPFVPVHDAHVLIAQGEDLPPSRRFPGNVLARPVDAPDDHGSALIQVEHEIEHGP